MSLSSTVERILEDCETEPADAVKKWKRDNSYSLNDPVYNTKDSSANYPIFDMLEDHEDLQVDVYGENLEKARARTENFVFKYSPDKVEIKQLEKGINETEAVLITHTVDNYDSDLKDTALKASAGLAAVGVGTYLWKNKDDLF